MKLLGPTITSLNTSTGDNNDSSDMVTPKARYDIDTKTMMGLDNAIVTAHKEKLA